jgi:hypothetical protein
MRNRKKGIFIALSIAAVVGLLAFFAGDREPRYNGRSLSTWYVLWVKAGEEEDDHADARKTEAAYAIRQIGTNAIPILLKRLRTQYSQGLRFYLWRTLPARVTDLRVVSFLLAGPRRAEPTSTFVILGPTAAPAVTELATLFRATNNPDLARSAAYCLAAIGPDGLPPLLAALADPTTPSCGYAVYWLGMESPFNFGTNIARAVPLLAQCTTAADPDLAKAATRALGRIRMEPQVAIPALTNCLNSTNTLIRCEGLHSLARFGNQCIPLLERGYLDSDESVRRTATNCLHALARESATNAPPR